MVSRNKKEAGEESLQGATNGEHKDKSCTCSRHGTGGKWGSMSHQHVIRLDVAMEDPTVAQMLESQEELRGVRSYSRQLDADVAAVLLEHLPQVHFEGLEDEAQVVPEVEGREQAHAVPLVVGVPARDLGEDDKLLLSRLEPESTAHRG